MLVFEERGKLDYPEKNLSKQRSEPTTNEGGEKKRFKKTTSFHIGYFEERRNFMEEVF